MFEPYLSAWSLIPDGAPVVTRAARLLPVRRHGEPAVLKISHEPDERFGAIVMEWWDGDGAARVLAHDGDALLLERAMGAASLSAMAHTGQDDAACGILCATANRLHAPRAKSPPDLTPLTHWFRELWPAARTRGGILIRSAETAEALLADQREIVVLHGDLHHDNVLDFGARGWLAIDPKHLIGERGFDFANIFTNPDLADPTRPVATEPGRFARRLEIVVEAARLDRRRLLSWIVAWTGLSAAWFLGDEDPLAEIDLQIASLAAAELDRMA
ncbi:APH(6) family putative aminoglycoside O-phosphotransferase [Bradyrhizobium sp. SK17]|jgi:streptomycin 6-kinase|uniref:aminoglycoside phosphotransferase family protein n=1 Tax=Bradyrhizobium sp. SK17 TaxID=2057741 RepID=UPI000C319AAF|nr:aminoglycoside phosphotransferase family protein [Bradyrhizobium sp. SK17]AUC97062.1 APH(6) family putative aminoglycoside O-phosphotransferase [Bradyrhizobium sp. SK17]